MASVDSDTAGWTPITDQDKELVRMQMNRLLKTSHFNNSRRYPMLFRYIVEETLEGRGEFLKERLLGVRVFERPADYDTATDPIVRVTIAEIRKRIAQYYHEEAHESEMRIELLPGHYVPQFRLAKEAGSDQHHASERESIPEGEQAIKLPALPAPSQTTAVLPLRTGRKARFSLLVRFALGSAVALLIVLGAGLWWKSNHTSALDEFWGPFLADHRTVIFCVPVMHNTGEAMADAAGILVKESASTANQVNAPPASSSSALPTTTFLGYEVLGENIAFADVLATQRISNYLAAHNRESNLRPNTVTTLDDLRQGPVILIGGLDNQWTLRALTHLRYRFAATSQEQYWIMDTKNPAMKDWRLDLKVPLSAVKHDYAIIARIHDESTGQIEMIAAGIGMSGTAAAGEFLVDHRQMDELRRRVGSGFRDHDLEAVLSTDVVNGIAGSPRILTVAVW